MCINAHAQERHQSFIMEFKNVYTRNIEAFQRKSEDAFQRRYEVFGNISEEGIRSLEVRLNDIQKKIDSTQSEVSFLFIPQLLLRNSRRLYRDIDTTNLVKYLDPQSMFYYRTLVSLDSLFIGDIRGGYPGHPLCMFRYDIFLPKPRVDNFPFERLYNQLRDINPDMVFTVQNIGWYFFIKDNHLFALRPMRVGDFIIYSIDEYTEKFSNQIFDVFFRFTPRVMPIGTCNWLPNQNCTQR